MPNNLNTRQRQQRQLTIPEPGRKGNIKVTREGWLACAKVVLIEEGISAVKVDRLAKRLNVTRGGFYYHFKNHHGLLEDLLEIWRSENRFTPVRLQLATPEEAARTLEAICDDVMHERGFDPQFDMAIREWARISAPVASVVHKVDDERTVALQRVFAAIGYPQDEAYIRARVFYTHQIGYYTIGVDESIDVREKNLRIYLEVLGGSAFRRLSSPP